MEQSQKKTVVLNTLSLFTSQAWIVLLAFLALPYIVNSLGKEAYALLSLSFIVIGYLGFLDLGLGNALTKFVSEYYAKRDFEKINSIISTSFLIFLVMGFFGGFLLLLVSNFLVENIFKVTLEFKRTALYVLYITSIGFSVTLLKNYANAIPTGFQQITLVSICEAIFNSLKLLITVGFIFLGYGILEIVFGSVIVTLLQVIAVVIFTKKPYSIVSIRPAFKKNIAIELLRYSLPLSIATIASNFIIHLDKFMITVFLPFARLAYYTVSYDISSKLWYIPNNVTKVFFPVFSKYFALKDTDNLKKYYFGSFRYIVMASTFVSFLLVGFAFEIFRFWINPDYAQSASYTLQILSLGLLMSCYACVPFSLITACGFTNVVAKVHILIAIINLVLCIILIPLIGIEGAALAWLIEHIVDFLILLKVVKHRIIYINLTDYVRKIFVKPLILSLLIVFMGKYLGSHFINSLYELLLVCFICSFGYFLMCYVFLLNKEEKAVIDRGLGNVLGKLGFSYGR